MYWFLSEYDTEQVSSPSGDAMAINNSSLPRFTSKQTKLHIKTRFTLKKITNRWILHRCLLSVWCFGSFLSVFIYFLYFGCYFMKKGFVFFWGIFFIRRAISCVFWSLFGLFCFILFYSYCVILNCCLFFYGFCVKPRQESPLWRRLMGIQTKSEYMYLV